jgi:hypothetical protein
MAVHTGGGIRVCSRSRSKEDSGGSLAPAVCLALHVHDGDDGRFPAASLSADHFAYPCCQRKRFLKPDFPVACTGKASLRIWYHAKKPDRVFTESDIRS